MTTQARPPLFTFSSNLSDILQRVSNYAIGFDDNEDIITQLKRLIFSDCNEVGIRLDDDQYNRLCDGAYQKFIKYGDLDLRQRLNDDLLTYRNYILELSKIDDRSSWPISSGPPSRTGSNRAIDADANDSIYDATTANSPNSLVTADTDDSTWNESAIEATSDGSFTTSADDATEILDHEAAVNGGTGQPSVPQSNVAMSRGIGRLPVPQYNALPIVLAKTKKTPKSKSKKQKLTKVNDESENSDSSDDASSDESSSSSSDSD